VGMLIGTWFSGIIVDNYKIAENAHNWTKIWLVPAYVAIAVLVYFVLLFKEKKT
jgi:phosphotransferase system  glucose/maltose/N-acetylglucosamine-specific IIC component